MSKKQPRKKRTLNRAMPVPVAPGGSLLYVPAGMQQSPYGQTFYGNSTKNTPVGQTSLFSPGEPLPTQDGVNPGGLPVQFRFPVAYNTFPVDRTLGSPDIPSFEQLKRLAKMDYGVGLCERFWLDMVPRMTVKIKLTEEAVAGGAEEKRYQSESKYFKNFFTTPDARNGVDIHAWMRSALINQSRYDELYLYKNRTRGGQLLGVEVIDGSQMKPLLDDWGRLPAPPNYAYQQYPWGIPGWQYTQEQMVHYRETPASDTPYGFSRIERIILITNLALRKQRQDLAHFTEGNIPAGILMPPEGSNWTPDQLDSYEQSWNALLAGNLQQLARIKVVQPGFSYTPFVQPNFDSVIDRFWLNIRTAAYGMTMADLGFTETVNKSSGDSQENVTYRRTIGPIAMIYAAILTDILQHDFEPSLHGGLFEVAFGGYEESEDATAKAQELTMYTNAGILGLTNAAKLAKLPEDPDAPHIGRVFMTANGPIFLDDMASDKMRDAAAQAKLAGLQLATNAPQPGENDDDPEGKPPNSEKSGDDNEENTQGHTEEKSQAQAKTNAKGTAHASASATQDDDGRGTQKRSRSDGGDIHVSTSDPAISLPAAMRDPSVERLAQDEARPTRRGPHTQIPDRAGLAVVQHDIAHMDELIYELKCILASWMPDKGATDEPSTSQDPTGKARSLGDPGRRDREPATRTTSADPTQFGATGDNHEEAVHDYRRWRTRAIDDVKAGKTQRGFSSTYIPERIHHDLTQLLKHCTTADQIRTVFSRVQESELIGATSRLEYNATLDIWEPADTDAQLAVMRAQGTQYLRWTTHSSNSGTCPLCDLNDGQVVAVGMPFKSGHRLPQCHNFCQCAVDQLKERP